MKNLSSSLHPRRVGSADVSRIEAATAVFRALDYRDGGGSCRSAVEHLRAWGEESLLAARSDRVRARMLVALADLCNLAGWIAFDTGMTASARVHFGRALDLARLAGRADLVANIYYRMGRVELHQDAAPEALQLFRSGLAAAREHGAVHAVAILCANEAWAHAKLGVAAEAEGLVGQAADALARSDRDRIPGWAVFFTENDLAAMVGSVYTELAVRTDRGYAAMAIPALSGAIAGYGREMARSRAFCLISLSLNHLLDGDTDQADSVGALAVEAAAALKSLRTLDRMRPLRDEADRRSADPAARHLADRLRAFNVKPCDCGNVSLVNV